MTGSKGYNRKGLYNSYDKKHKEREALDYYATPTEEVENILHHLNIDFDKQSILEPCVGGGHMLEGIFNYLTEDTLFGYTNIPKIIISTDIKNRMRGYYK